MLSNPFIALLFLLLLWSLNALSSYYYFKKVNNEIVTLKKMYKGKERFMGAVVKKVNIFRKVMMIIVTDYNGTITECKYLYGYTNFSKFKKKDDIVGKNIDQIINSSNEDKFIKAIQGCAEKIKEQKIKTIA
ncbi:hypothetical protein DDV21_011460 [Streptococcus chenjunshii]|uniref:Uncharacterized protein n=1 Tax=Streptococcus chenjunshii TaxID=2173853 RepID=A0A372KM94_9STRE|nr:transcriptional regulator GutM [Streptococcus chenjunshii]AXQ79633.1 hypothetical protein DDV21_011460 [Streptococcus chenjunshii]RFU51052.1 hypothetical protein DDV22_05590 [Streptococcus chenjunshii]RFU53096.1 hypothetical protein DDV23_06385 [Streptococcus chenjunshii]